MNDHIDDHKSFWGLVFRGGSDFGQNGQKGRFRGFLGEKSHNPVDFGGFGDLNNRLIRGGFPRDAPKSGGAGPYRSPVIRGGFPGNSLKSPLKSRFYPLSRKNCI